MQLLKIVTTFCLQIPQSVTAAAATPAGLPQLPARPAAATAAAEAAAKRATAGSLAASNSSAPSNRSAVNNGPAITQAAEEIAKEAGLVMADAGIPQTSGHSAKEPLGHSQAANGHADGLPRGVLRTSPKKSVPAASAKDVSSRSAVCGIAWLVQYLYSPTRSALVAVEQAGAEGGWGAGEGRQAQQLHLNLPMALLLGCNRGHQY